MLIFLKEAAFGFVDSLYCSLSLFFFFYLGDLSPKFDYFLLSTCLGCVCFFFF
jgi:hypothetical protein